MSNYGDFELVREAMKLGVYDYILKLTLKSEEFIEMMGKIAAEISEYRFKSHKFLSERIKQNESRQTSKALFFKELLMGEDYDEREILKKARILDIDVDPGRAYLLYIMLEHPLSPSVTGLHGDRLLLAFSVSNIVSEIIGEKPGLEIVELSPDRFAVIVPAAKDDASGEKALQAALNISRSVQTYINITLSIVVGKEFQGFCEMKDMFRKCLEYSNIRFYKGFGAIIGMEPRLGTGSQSSMKSFLIKTKEGLVKSLEFGELEEACAGMDNFLQLSAQQSFDPVELKKHVFEMLEETGKLFNQCHILIYVQSGLWYEISLDTLLD